jgi:Mg-chelatase subunit ChlD
MTSKLTEMVFIIDRSGSMSGLESDTIGGFNSMIEKQRKDGDALVSTILFSDRTEILHDRVDLEKVGKLTAEEYYVTGSTALLDAVGETIERIKRIQKSSPGASPDTTLFVIITDGQENSSREYSYKKVKKLIKKQKEEGWDFLFLGANIDVAAEADRMGIGRKNSVEYCCDAAGISMMYEEVGTMMKTARRKGSFDRD